MKVVIRGEVECNDGTLDELKDSTVDIKLDDEDYNTDTDIDLTIGDLVVSVNVDSLHAATKAFIFARQLRLEREQFYT